MVPQGARRSSFAPERGAYSLPMDALYTSGHVVDRECDTLVESFVVHSSFVEQVEPDCEGRQSLFLIFLSNIPYA